MEKINSAYNGSWIAVTERVPEPEVFVLCWDGKETFVEWFGSKPDAGRGVTHWMPYPMPQGATSDMHDGSRALSHPAPVAGEQRIEMLGMRVVNLIPEAGHVMTLRDHHCGEFKDDFDWSTLPQRYLHKIGRASTSTSTEEGKAG